MTIAAVKVDHIGTLKPGDRVLLTYPGLHTHRDVVETVDADGKTWIIEVLDVNRVIHPTDAIASIGATLDTPRIGVVLGARAAEATA